MKSALMAAATGLVCLISGDIYAGVKTDGPKLSIAVTNTPSLHLGSMNGDLEAIRNGDDGEYLYCWSGANADYRSGGCVAHKDNGSASCATSDPDLVDAIQSITENMSIWVFFDPLTLNCLSISTSKNSFSAPRRL